MPFLFRPACWALVLILLALAQRAGLVSEEAARTLFIVLPIVAVLGLKAGRRCAPAGREA